MPDRNNEPLKIPVLVYTTVGGFEAIQHPFPSRDGVEQSLKHFSKEYPTANYHIVDFVEGTEAGEPPMTPEIPKELAHFLIASEKLHQEAIKRLVLFGDELREWRAAFDDGIIHLRIDDPSAPVAFERITQARNAVNAISPLTEIPT